MKLVEEMQIVKKRKILLIMDQEEIDLDHKLNSNINLKHHNNHQFDHHLSFNLNLSLCSASAGCFLALG